MQVLAALRDTDVPVPRALFLATDASIIGTPFYVMEHVQVCTHFSQKACSLEPQGQQVSKCAKIN